MKFKFIFALVFVLMLSFTFVSADMGANVNMSHNVKAVTTSVKVNTTPGVPHHPLLISPNPESKGLNNNSHRADMEVEITRCVAELRTRFKSALPAAELRYICENRLRIPHKPGMYVARNVHSSVWDCVANLTRHTNKTLSEIRRECFSQFINNKLTKLGKGNKSIEEDLNTTLRDPRFRHELIAHMITNKKAMVHILNNSGVAHKLINISGANKSELKREVRFFMKEKVLRRAFIARLRKDHKLLENKTVVASFLPDNFRLNNRTKIEKIELPNNDTVVVRVNVHARILGILPASYSAEVMNSNGSVRVKRPFWAFLAR